MSSQSDLCLDLSLERNAFKLAVNLILPARGITVFFGPSGSGKTTILRCVAGLEHAKGRVTIGDETWQDSTHNRWMPTWARDLGYVFQEASLFEHLDVQANLQYGVDRAKKSGGKKALDAAVDLLGIGHLLNRSTQRLSGGERQRVAIARALATQPKILLLDEPLASLDIARRHEILPWLERMHHELRIPMLYVTHTMEELTRLADHIVLMDSGKVRLQGSIFEVLSDPVFAGTAGDEAGAVLNGTIERHDDHYHLTCVNIHGTDLWVRQQNLSVGSRVRLHIHANDVSLTTSEPQNTSIQNLLPGVIETIGNDGHPASCLIKLRHHDQHIIARITRKSLEHLKLEIGRSVWIQIKTVALIKY